MMSLSQFKSLLQPSVVDGGRRTDASKNTKPQSAAQPGVSKIIVGKIYADWCPHCQNMAGMWDEFKSEMKRKKGEEVEFVEIEDKDMNTKLTPLNTKYFHGKGEGVKSNGYPTLFKFHVDSPQNTLDYFSKERSVPNLMSWVDDSMKSTAKRGGAPTKSRKTRLSERGKKRNGKKGGNRKTRRSRKYFDRK